MQSNDNDTLSRLLEDAIAAGGPRACLHYRGEAISYARVQAASARVARGLMELGVQRGDRVAIWLPNTPAWLACFFACARIGAIALATNTRFRSAEIEDILGRSEAKALVYWPAFRGIDFSDILEALDARAVSALRAVVAYQEPGDPVPPERVHGVPLHGYAKLDARPALDFDASGADLGCLMFTTSGTTKAPKFVLHTQRSIVQHARDVAQSFEYLGSDTVGLGVLPFCGTYGFSTGLAPIAVGAPLIVEALFDARRTLDLIRSYRVTNANLTSHMIAAMVAVDTDEDAYASIRFCGCGSGASEVIAPAAARGLLVVGVYGSSEVQALFSHQDPGETALEQRALGGGWQVSGLACVRARNVETGELAAHGEPGALEIRAPSQMMGYFGNPEATREAFTDDGFYRTGDLGYTLADGRFIFQSRLGDALRLSGFLVSPAQIESVLIEHPSIAACQVVGVETAGEVRPFAFVTCMPGHEFRENDVLAFARARMARYKLPARIFRLDAFPTVQSANAIKVQKARLREIAVELLHAQPDSN